MRSTPTEFDPGPWDESHLVIKRRDELFHVTWPLAGFDVTVDSAREPSHEKAVAHTPGLVFHGSFGFSLNRFHEFFIDPVPEHLEFRIGEAFVSVGQPTPLAIFLFEAEYERHFHGDEWGNVASIRINELSIEFLEAYLLNSLDAASKRFGLTLSLLKFEPPVWWEDAPPDAEIDDITEIPVEIVPLRLLYYAARQSEPAAACIHYYRILEYYAFFAQQDALAAARVDRKLSSREFLLKAAEILMRDERGTIVRLVKELAQTPLLRQAEKMKLVLRPEADLFANALYEFRNSIVHAKQDHRSPVIVPPTIAEDRVSDAWRIVLGELASRAVKRFSPRHP